MKKLHVLILFSIAVVFGLTPASAQSPVLDSAKTKAIQILDLLRAEKFHAIVEACDAQMKRQIDEDKLEGIWGSMLMSYGEVKEVGQPTAAEQEGYLRTVTPLKFGKALMNLKINFDSNYLIAGFFITPGQTRYSPATYVHTENFIEFKPSFGKRPFLNAGTLAIPKGQGPFPVVIIVHGSGPIDRDCSIGPNKIYRDLAWGLASDGIATFRYDKRTFAYQKEMIAQDSAGKKPFDVRNEYLEDLHDVIQLLANRPELDKNRIFIVGHSEGGYLIPLINKSFHEPAGFISMAGTLREIPELALEQLDYLTEGASNAGVDQMRRCMSNSLAANVKKEFSSDSVMQPFPVNYWLYLKSYHPASLATQMKKPLLVLQGERDYQVKMKDFQIWQKTLEGKTNMSVKSYPALNHLFLEGKGPSSAAEYNVQGNIPEVVISDIANWIKQFPKK